MDTRATASDDPRWTDALLAATILAVDPVGVGGIVMAAQAGPVRDTWWQFTRSLLPEGAPIRRLPAYIPDSRLLGGLDLVATLKAGRPVVERGLLAEAEGGVVVLPMAERLPATLVGRLVAVLDQGEVILERDGLALRMPMRFGIVAFDEGQEDERAAAALRDRLALHVGLDGVRYDADVTGWPGRSEILAAQSRLAAVTAGPDMIAALCAAALAFGIHSSRAPLLALRVARASAALADRDAITAEDVTVAARLVYGPRATQMPAAPPEEAEQDAPSEQSEAPAEREDAPRDPPPSDSNPPDEPDAEPPSPPASGELQDQVIEAARAAIPAGLLASLGLLDATPLRAQSSGRVGQFQASMRRGRPAGVRKGSPRAGIPLNVIETLRAAAPWQRLRRQQQVARGVAPSTARIDVRPEDFHVTRYRQRTGTTTVFVLDASGSSALQRLGEAKGAVELLLADCYVRRDQVAVLAFRGRTAEILLPPTRSLVRAKRSLGGLPGGGGTPLAAGIEAASVLADGLRRRGMSPTVVLLTDGRGNVARDGTTGRAVAEADALKAAGQLRAARIACLLIDTSNRPTEQAMRLAGALGARYVPLPHASSAALATAVQGAQSSQRAAR